MPAMGDGEVISSIVGCQVLETPDTPYDLQLEQEDGGVGEPRGYGESFEQRREVRFCTNTARQSGFQLEHEARRNIGRTARPGRTFSPCPVSNHPVLSR